MNKQETIGSPKHRLLLAFYGDDFTGSTDALEFLSKAGARTVLFIEPPSEEQLQKYDKLDAIGVAGMTRAMTPADMEKELESAFVSLRNLDPKHIHYKVCSTFDSSPEIGSIGKAIDVGASLLPNTFIPLLVAVPVLGRYCVFGNLFARMGIGSGGEIYRLDRHPSMSKHPVTPSDESDLRLHLSKQTSKKTGLLDILDTDEQHRAEKSVRQQIEKGYQVILFDALYEHQMPGIGKLIDGFAVDDGPLFSVGSSGIEMALAGYWKEMGVLKGPPEWGTITPAQGLLVVSGSCSPVSSGQISYALRNGFKEIILDTPALTEGKQSCLEDHAVSAIAYIKEGYPVIIHTDCGNRSPHGLANTSAIFGDALGSIARKVAAGISSLRIVVAGGDTSSYAARAMGIEAVEMIAPLSPGAPLCKAYAPGSPVNGLEVNFKGGQVGKEDYFEMVLNGKSNPG